MSSVQANNLSGEGLRSHEQDYVITWAADKCIFEAVNLNIVKDIKEREGMVDKQLPLLLSTPNGPFSCRPLVPREGDTPSELFLLGCALCTVLTHTQK
jgi:hypothetical protein